MQNRLIIFIVSMLWGIVSNPGILLATDDFAVQEPDFHAVETIEKTDEINAENDENVNNDNTTEEKTQANPTPVAKAEPATAPAPVTPAPAPAPAPKPATPVYTEPANNIKITGKTLEIINVATTTEDAGNHVNRYGDKFLYGHNSSNVFGGLTSLGVGSTFSVTLNGVTKTYRVAEVVIFEKNINSKGKGVLQINGSGSYMSLVASAKHAGVQYDLSIMTCHGTPLPGRDATHRLVIFANVL